MVAFRTTSPCPAYCRSTSKICHLFLLRDEVDAQGEGGKKEEKDGDEEAAVGAFLFKIRKGWATPCSWGSSGGVGCTRRWGRYGSWFWVGSLLRRCGRGIWYWFVFRRLDDAVDEFTFCLRRG